MQAGRVAAIRAAQRSSDRKRSGQGSSSTSSSTDATATLSSMFKSAKEKASKTASAASSAAMKGMGAAKEKLGISKSSDNAPLLEPTSSEILESDPDCLKQLLTMGFSRGDAIWALKQVGPGKTEAAVSLLTSALDPMSEMQSGREPVSAAEAVRQMEASDAGNSRAPAVVQGKSPFKGGDWVMIHGLETESGMAMNGKTGRVVSYEPSMQRFIVDIGGTEKMLRPANLKKASMTTSMQKEVKASMKSLKATFGLSKSPMPFALDEHGNPVDGSSAEDSTADPAAAAKASQVNAQRRAEVLAAAERRQEEQRLRIGGTMEDYRRQQRRQEEQRAQALQEQRKLRALQSKAGVREPTAALMESLPEVNIETPAMVQLMTSQLIAEPGNPTKTEILPSLDMGRSGDTANHGYALVVCATNAETNLNVDLQTVEVLQICGSICTAGNDSESDAELLLQSLRSNGQELLHDALTKIDAMRQAGKNVLVCCEEGREKSAIIMLAYIMARFAVSVQAAFRYVQSLRPIVSLLPMYSEFLSKEFQPPILASAEAPQPSAAAAAAQEDGEEHEEDDLDMEDAEQDLQRALEMSMGFSEEQQINIASAAAAATEEAEGNPVEDTATLAAMQQSSLDPDAEVMDVPEGRRDLDQAQMQQAMIEEEMELQRALALSVETERAFLDQERVDMACAVAISQADVEENTQKVESEAMDGSTDDAIQEPQEVSSPSAALAVTSSDAEAKEPDIDSAAASPTEAAVQDSATDFAPPARRASEDEDQIDREAKPDDADSPTAEVESLERDANIDETAMPSEQADPPLDEVLACDMTHEVANEADADNATGAHHVETNISTTDGDSSCEVAEGLPQKPPSPSASAQTADATTESASPQSADATTEDDVF